MCLYLTSSLPITPCSNCQLSSVQLNSEVFLMILHILH
ncbi:hypothetical protein CoNPh26_CDS0124 [Staphylococcus phage S-CoN_Ph26]|nr:hypothetical protein CoNPh26_CDS0124 [Staphylococcus phage S-CoN_Ph26]